MNGIILGAGDGIRRAITLQQDVDASVLVKLADEREVSAFGAGANVEIARRGPVLASGLERYPYGGEMVYVIDGDVFLPAGRVISLSVQNDLIDTTSMYGVSTYVTGMRRRVRFECEGVI